ncbi:MAG: TIGR01777 family oxidoreductase [Bacteriovoracaceae bacterium]|nr:TIGR01777 family oxidoreductase [Bacteriovoracaceae bacterium]
MKVLVTGATGFVGRVIVRQLLEAGDEVNVLTRHIPGAALTLGGQCHFFQWTDVSKAPPAEAFQGVDAVINLMGEGIAEKRWDEEQKKKIRYSRIEGTRSLVNAVKALGMNAPRTFVSTSAIGIYGPRGDEEITEEEKTAQDFLATVCKDWELEAKNVESSAVRLVILRVGVVLGRGGGALKKMIPIFKLGGGGPVGSGKQWMSWIHVEDLAGMFIRAAKESEMKGIYNATAPYPATNKDFSKVLGKVLKRPAFAPAPAFVMKAVFGEMSTALLDGQRVIPKKMQDQVHFHYRYPTLEMALKETAY